MNLVFIRINVRPHFDVMPSVTLQPCPAASSKIHSMSSANRSRKAGGCIQSKYL